MGEKGETGRLGDADGVVPLIRVAEPGDVIANDRVS